MPQHPLPPASLDPGSPTHMQVQAELVSMLFRHSARIRFSNFIAVGIAALFLWSRVPHGPLVAWTALSCLQTALHMGLDRRFLSNPPPREHALRWAWIFTAFSAVAGALWGLLGVVFFAPGDFVVTGFIIIVTAGISTGSIAPLSPFRPAYYVAAIAMIVPFALRSLLHDDNVSRSLGVLLLLLLYANLSSCNLLHKSLSESILLRFENLDLVRQLTREKGRAESANRAKTQFLAAASHDLRQPAHALGLFVGTLDDLGRRAHVRPDEIAIISDRLKSALKSMGRLLNALRDTCRLDSGAVEIDLRSIGLAAPLAELRNEHSDAAGSKGLALEIAACDLRVLADATLLQQILANLLSNAIRYTHRGDVSVRCSAGNNQVCIEVRDTGIGIAEDQHERIFQEFYQVDDVARDREQGMGLGLAIVKRSVELLGGRIAVRSRAGQGSVFSVWLPEAAAIAAPEPRVADPGETARTFAGRTILVIDDDPEVRSALHQLLSAWGHAVVSAADVAEAVRTAQEVERIDLILADYRLGGPETGRDAIAAVHRAMGREIPSIVITGDTSPQRLHDAGASGLRVLHKPLDPETLRALVLEASPAHRVPR